MVFAVVALSKSGLKPGKPQVWESQEPGFPYKLILPTRKVRVMRLPRLSTFSHTLPESTKTFQESSGISPVKDIFSQWQAAMNMYLLSEMVLDIKSISGKLVSG